MEKPVHLFAATWATSIAFSATLKLEPSICL